MIGTINKVLKTIFGSKHERDMKKIRPVVNLINTFEVLFTDVSNEYLQQFTDKFIKYVSGEVNLPDNYISDLLDKVLEKINYVKSKDIEELLSNLRNVILAGRKRIEEKFKEEKYGNVILNSLSDKRIERLINEYRDRIEKIKSYSQEDITVLKVEYNNWWTAYLDSLNKKEVLDKILPEAFAVVREAGMRVLGLRLFDVQLMGGLVLHQGKIAEMKTGEGKTLAATLPVYLNSLTGKGVHVVTVNEYLAKRDSIWMGELYLFLKRSVGLIVNGMPHSLKQESYNSDITFGTNNEFGFDYLRDNMAVSRSGVVQREHHYAIIDEVDSILIDEARTPLIISGPAEESTEKYYKINRLFPYLKKGERIEEMDNVTESGDYFVDEKAGNTTLTEQGVAKCEKLLNIDNLYSPANMDTVHHIIQMLRAHNLFKRDYHYIVKDGSVLIVDEFTGRLMPGRRWSDGLHQAVEAKEGVRIEEESQTLATVTLQNYFRMYDKLAGMTGTADTEAKEFMEIYKLEVVVIPTNLPMIRKDYDDAIYRTKEEKYEAIVEIIKELYEKGRPVLVGTISIEVSELISGMIKKKGVKHQVLNAKYHEKEAEIISRAGEKNAVTIATNMAGRGTDIVLGEGVAELGGLCVIGTERHESRRIDNQLRGRSGRQGDNGESKFFVSLEDDLMRLFGSDRVSGIMKTLGMERGQEIAHPFITKSLERAQKKVEDRNFDIRKHLLKFDDIMNEQRELIYKQRNMVLYGENIREHIYNIIEDEVDYIVEDYCPKKVHIAEWDIPGLTDKLFGSFQIRFDKEELRQITDADEMYDILKNKLKEVYNSRIEDIGEEEFGKFESFVMLKVIDENWKDHLYNLDHLYEGIHLRGMASKDPVIEYKREGMGMFNMMIDNIKTSILDYLFKIKGYSGEETTSISSNMELSHSEMLSFSSDGSHSKTASGSKRRAAAKKKSNSVSGVNLQKVGRNSPCPCGSGKKYKKCCGR